MRRQVNIPLTGVNAGDYNTRYTVPIVLTKEVIMRNLIASSGMAVCLMLALATGCSDKNSPDACKYETTMNLDKGNFDAVLQSSCATAMQLGAAYFGKAGFTVTSVINSLVTAQTTSANTALRQYLTSLTGKVTDSTLINLDSSHSMFSSIPPASDLYQDAQFNLSVVDSIKALSLIKTVIDLNDLGTLSSCDINGNSKPDEADAMACSLLVSGTTLTGGACPAPLASFATYTTTPTDLLFTSLTGAYKGFVATIADAAPDASCPADYKKLFYLNADGKYYAATTSGTCQANDGQLWPCPVTSQIDLVAALDYSISSSITALSTAISGTATTEVETALQDIKIQACGSLTSTCTAASIANYLQQHL